MWSHRLIEEFGLEGTFSFFFSFSLPPVRKPSLSCLQITLFFHSLTLFNAFSSRQNQELDRLRFTCTHLYSSSPFKFQKCKQIYWQFMKMCPSFLLLFTYSGGIFCGFGFGFFFVCYCEMLRISAGDKMIKGFNRKYLAESHWQPGRSGGMYAAWRVMLGDWHYWNNVIWIMENNLRHSKIYSRVCSYVHFYFNKKNYHTVLGEMRMKLVLS